MPSYTTEWNADKCELTVLEFHASGKDHSESLVGEIQSKMILSFEQLCAIERYLEEKRTYQPSRVDLEELVKLLVSALAKER